MCVRYYLIFSIIFTFFCRKENFDEQNAPEHISGNATIIETVNQKKFQISPNSFFQPCTPAVEVLLKVIEELVKPNKNMTLLDVCCGVGTIGISLAEVSIFFSLETLHRHFKYMH